MQVAEIMLTWVTVSVPPRAPLPAEPLIEPLALAPLDPADPEPLAVEPVEPEPVELEPVEPVEPAEPVAEPVPDEEPAPDEDAPEPLGEDELLIELPAPPKRPVTMTWCPTCCDRSTELSAISRRSEPPRPLMLPPRPAVDEDDSLPVVEPEPEADEPAPPEAVEPAPEPEPVAPEPVEPDVEDPVEPAPDDEAPLPELDPEPMLLPPPMRAFFSTKLPPDPPLAEALLVSLLLELELEPDPSARCRHPVAVTEPAVSDEDLPVELCGVLDVGDCAASAPHRATLLLSVIAHCQ